MIKQTEDFCFFADFLPFSTNNSRSWIRADLMPHSGAEQRGHGWCWRSWTLHGIPRHDQVDINTIFRDIFGDIVAAGDTVMMSLIFFIVYFCWSSCWLEIYFGNLFSKIQDGRRRGPLQPNKQNKGQVGCIFFPSINLCCRISWLLLALFHCENLISTPQKPWELSFLGNSELERLVVLELTWRTCQLSECRLDFSQRKWLS